MPPGAVLERPAHGAGAGGEASLIERHREPDRPRPRVVAPGRGLRALPLHETGDLPIELEFGTVDREIRGARNAPGEHRLRGPLAVGPALREIDHRFLRAPQIERRPPALHSFAHGCRVGIGVAVEELQEQREVLRVSLVRRRGQQKHMVGAVAQDFAERIARRLAGRRRPGHAVRLVDDRQVPARLTQTGQDIGPLGEVERHDDLFLLQPPVDAEPVADVAAPENEERLVELLPELALPLERQVRGANHDYPFGKSAQLELPHEEARHHRLAGAGVVGEQEPHRGQFEQMFVDGLEPMRERVHPGYREAEIRVELPGDAERPSLESEPQKPAVAVICERRVGDRQARYVVRRQGDAAEPLRPQPDQAREPGVRAVRADGFDPHRLAEQRAGENLSFVYGSVAAHRPIPARGSAPGRESCGRRVTVRPPRTAARTGGSSAPPAIRDASSRGSCRNTVSFPNPPAAPDRGRHRTGSPPEIAVP